MRTPTNWATADDNTLRTMAATGASGSTIAAAIGRTRNSVTGRAHRLGISLGGAQRPGGKALRVRKSANKMTTVKANKPRAIVAATGPVPPTAVPELLPSATASAKPVALLELEDGMCKWPVGEGMSCGNTTTTTRKPYCAGHSRERHQPLPQRQPRRAGFGLRHWQ